MAPKMYRGLSILPKLETPLCGLVGERFICSEVGAVRPGGANRSENAGMSSVMQMRYLHTENPRFPSQCISAKGKSALRVFLVKGD